MKRASVTVGLGPVGGSPFSKKRPVTMPQSGFGDRVRVVKECFLSEKNISNVFSFLARTDQSRVKLFFPSNDESMGPWGNHVRLEQSATVVFPKKDSELFQGTYASLLRPTSHAQRSESSRSYPCHPSVLSCSFLGVPPETNQGSACG